LRSRDGAPRSGAAASRTTGAIVLNRADVCTVHYLHNGRARSVKRMHRPIPFTGERLVAGVMGRAAEQFVYSSSARSAALVAVSGPLAKDLLDTFEPARRDLADRDPVDTERPSG
jgi:hypothetical protein